MVKRTRFDDHACAIARTADLLGDWWMPLVVRELLMGRKRFNEIQERLDINRSLLSSRVEYRLCIQLESSFIHSLP